MMNHGLLAPQFGLVRHVQPDENFAFEQRSQAPTVIVKRRRILEGLTTVQAEVEPSPPVQREPKVYRRETVESKVASSSQEGGPEASVSTAEPTAPAVVRRRRSRDPLRAPSQVQHVVFETRPAQEAVSAAELLSFDMTSAAEYREVQEALQHLREEVSKLLEGRRAIDSLTRLMKSARKT